MPHDPAGRPADGPVLECWMVLAALAEQTAAVALGSLVLGNTYRHPAVVAHMAATLDQISQGRLVLGIGAGWPPDEHAAYGTPLPAARDRIAAAEGRWCHTMPGRRGCPVRVRTWRRLQEGQVPTSSALAREQVVLP